MTERRNFYRLLYVQPDAPLTVIHVNCRVIMEQLRLLPDRKLANARTGLLSAALEVLNDPLKRVDYDQQLQKRYSIKKLSLGALAKGFVQDLSGKSVFHINRRNYYRILQIQPDAPGEIVTACYQALLQYPFQKAELLKEAHTVLTDPSVRSSYDAFLANRGQSIKKDALSSNGVISAGTAGSSNRILAAVENGREVAMSYCLFCHAAYPKQHGHHLNKTCAVCDSPLPGSDGEQLEQQRADRRIELDGKLKFYLRWPGVANSGQILDLSPRGARFLVDAPLNLYDIIKIDATNFQAVAEVVHQQVMQSNFSVGVCFLAIQFEHERGNFLSARA